MIPGWRRLQTGDQQKFPGWQAEGWLAALFLCLLYLPQLALGLSGFEMSMILMPQIRGSAADAPHLPRTRVANTRKVLILSLA